MSFFTYYVSFTRFRTHVIVCRHLFILFICDLRLILGVSIFVVALLFPEEAPQNKLNVSQTLQVL